MYQTVMTAANGLQLANPPGDEDYQSLPSPLMTQVLPCASSWHGMQHCYGMDNAHVLKKMLLMKHHARNN
eukprot:4344909-Amphidinium_carterae.1